MTLSASLKIKNLRQELDKKVSLLIENNLSFEDPIQSRQQLISEIVSLDAELISLDLRFIEIKKMLNLFNEKLILLPEKQMELSAKIRDSEILNQNYTFLREKYEEANFGYTIDIGLKLGAQDAENLTGMPEIGDIFVPVEFDGSQFIGIGGHDDDDHGE